MKKHFILQKIIFLFIVTFFFNFYLFNTNSYAIELDDPYEVYNVTNRWFYIKNALTGKYLDVSGGVASPGTNVQEYTFNGTDSQKWYFSYIGNGEYEIYSYLGASVSPNSMLINYALDIDNGINADGTNVHIWNAIGGITQTYAVTPTDKGTYIIRTKCSNYDRCVTFATNGCSNGINAIQKSYLANSVERWILEPVDKYNENGILYATETFDQRLLCYPDLYNVGGDCTNFVSQCLLASGIHRNDNWYMEKKNNVYQIPEANTEQLQASWEFDYAWIHANNFKEYWKVNATRTYSKKGQYCLDNMYEIFNQEYVAGDIIQICGSFLGYETNATHSMIITSYGSQLVNGVYFPSYKVTYHSHDTIDKPLTEVYNSHSNNFFRMYQID